MIAEKICNDHNIRIVCIFRENSSRIKNKITRPFADTTLLQLKIKQLISSVNFTNIFLGGTCTGIDLGYDDKMFRKIYREIDNEIDNEVPFSTVLTDIFQNVKAKVGKTSHLLITYPTSPFFDAPCYTRAVVEYYKNVIRDRKHDSIVSVYKHKSFFYDHNRKAINYTPTAEGHAYTQDIKPVYELNNALYGGPLDLLLEKEYFLGDKPFFLECSKLESVDIDTPTDFKMAESFYQKASDIL